MPPFDAMAHGTQETCGQDEAKIVYNEDMATALEWPQSDIAYKAYKLPPKWAPASNANLAHVHVSWSEVPREFVYWCEIPRECVADIKKVR